MGVSVGVHVVLLLLFFLYECGRSDGPPFPIEEIGVSVDFGTVEEGSGEPIIEDPTQQTSPVDAEEDNDSEEEPVDVPDEPVIDEAQDTEVTTDPSDASDNMPVSEDGTGQVQQVQSNSSQHTQQTSPPPKPFTGGMKARTDGTTNKPGDEGNPDVPPTLDDHTGGGEDGNGFTINGWKWAGDPDWSKVGDGYGVISFDIDEFGDVTNIRIDNSSFTPSDKVEIEKIIRKLAFEKVNSGQISGRERVSGILDRRGY